MGAAAVGAGAAVVGAGASLINGANQASAASQEAQDQLQAANQADATQLSMYNQTQANEQPWLNSGTAAQNQLDYLMGISPQAGGNASSPTAAPNSTGASTTGASNVNFTGGVGTSTYDPTAGVTSADGAYGSLAQPFSMANFVADPGYNFSLQQGQQSLGQSAAAQGGLYSGAAMKALQTYGQNTAYNEYQQVYNNYQTNQSNLFSRLSGVAGSGQQAAANLGTAGSNAATQISNNQTSAGAAAAAGTVGASNAYATGLSGVSGAVNNAANQYLYQNPTGLNPIGSQVPTTYNGASVSYDPSENTINY